MNNAKYVFLGLVVLLVSVVVILSNTNSGESGPAPQSLDLYCAAGMKLPVVAVVKDYEEEYGVKVNIIYGGSGTLLNNL